MTTQLQQLNTYAVAIKKVYDKKSSATLKHLSLPDDYLTKVHSAHKKFIKSMSYEKKSKRANFSYREAEFLKFLFRAIERNNSGKIHNSMRWIYFTQKEVGEKLMCSEMSIYRITKSLVQKGVILKEYLSNNVLNRTLFYTLHPDILKYEAFFMRSNPSKSKDVITAGGVVVNTTTPVVINHKKLNVLFEKIDGKLLAQYMYDKTREILAHTEKLTVKLAQYLVASYKYCFKYDINAFLEYVHSLSAQKHNKIPIIQCFNFKNINKFYSMLARNSQSIVKKIKSIKTTDNFMKIKEILVNSENIRLKIKEELTKILDRYQENTQLKVKQLIGWFHKKYGDHEIVYAFKNADISIDDKKIVFCFETNFNKDFFLRKDRYLEFKEYVQKTYHEVVYTVGSQESRNNFTNIEDCSENDNKTVDQYAVKSSPSHHSSGTSYECDNVNSYVCLVA